MSLVDDFDLKHWRSGIVGIPVRNYRYQGDTDPVHGTTTGATKACNCGGTQIEVMPDPGQAEWPLTFWICSTLADEVDRVIIHPYRYPEP